MLAGKPDAGNPHVRFDEGEQRDWRKPPVALYSTFGAYGIVLWVHPLLHAINAILAFALVGRFVVGWPPLVAGLWVALYPPALNYARQLISEPWCVTVLLATFWAVLRPGWRWAAVAGLLAGLGVLVRTPMLGVWFLMVIAFVCQRRPRNELVAFASCSLLVLTAGTALVSYSTGHFTFLTTQGRMAVERMSVPGGEIFVPPEQ